ncbi:cyclin-L1-like [Mya arenaria]|uniref:cyclin-L1-like n=1 Tax=Mya arenaria TaxID=6604 RepID=UPI0022DEB0B1|nr:cyclin-L1-like [Mya arenaria]
MAEVTEQKPGATMERDFSTIILTLENVLIPDEKLSPTPSLLDGLDLDTETDLRILGCELIQTAGILLKLPQVAMATGQVLFQRFYYSKSFVKHNMEVLAMACINLASKIEECPRRIRDVINTFHHVKQIRNKKNIHPLVLDQNYINLKNQVIKAERRVLKELGFCVHVKHPHKVIVMFLQVLDANQNQKLVQCAWNYMNDSFRTDVFVRWHPETIACACIWLAARQLQVPLPNSPPWFELFGVDEDEIKEICLTILRLYARKKPNPEALEKRVTAARNLQLEAKKKARGLFSEADTPTSFSRNGSPKNVSPNPHTLIGELKKRIKKEEEERNEKSKKRRTRSRSRSSHSSRSYSPAPKKRKHRSPEGGSRKVKKEKYSPERRSKDSHKSRKRRHRSRSRSYSYSPAEDYKSGHKKRAKDRSYDYKDRDYKENKDRYYSPDRHTRKHHRNGHSSPSRLDKYEKYRR